MSLQSYQEAWVPAEIFIRVGQAQKKAPHKETKGPHK